MRANSPTESFGASGVRMRRRRHASKPAMVGAVFSEALGALASTGAAAAPAWLHDVSGT